jgi:transposase
MRPPPRGPDSGHDEVASDGGGEHWAVVASLIETCKLCDVEPHAYLADVIAKIANHHPNSQIDDLLPWAYSATPTLKAVA